MSLSPEEAAKLIPGLDGAERNYLLLEETSLDPRELCTALRAALLAAGVKLHEQERVRSADLQDEGVLLTSERRTLRADAFVNCCGAWVGAAGRLSEVVPRKGQMLVVAQPEGAPLLTRVLRSPEVYLIPRGDGRIVIGATVEDAGYSKLGGSGLHWPSCAGAPPACGRRPRMLCKWIAGLACVRARRMPCR